MKILYLIGIFFYYIRFMKEDHCTAADFFVLFIIFYIQVALDMVNNLVPSAFEGLLKSEAHGLTPPIMLILSQRSELAVLILLNVFVLFSFYGSRGQIKKGSVQRENTIQGYLRILVGAGADRR